MITLVEINDTITIEVDFVKRTFDFTMNDSDNGNPWISGIWEMPGHNVLYSHNDDFRKVRDLILAEVL